MSQRIQLDVFEPKSIRHSAGDRRLPRTGTSDNSDTRRHESTVALDAPRWPERVWPMGWELGFVLCGTPPGTRTRNLRIKSPMLYQLS